PEKGYCIHALNAVFLKTLNKWIRLDTCGNKEGIDAQFSIDEEKLAFTVQEELDEKDDPIIYVKPHPKTISTLEQHTNAIEMYKHYLPDYLLSFLYYESTRRCDDVFYRHEVTRRWHDQWKMSLNE